MVSMTREAIQGEWVWAFVAAVLASLNIALATLFLKDTEDE
jgi:hypothetical protein